MMMSAIAPVAPPIGGELLDRACSMQTTADYLTTVAGIVREKTCLARNSVRQFGAASAELGEWREIETLLSLLIDQADIVADFGRDAEAALQLAA